MTYKGELVKAMEMLAKDDKVVFIGYNVRYGPRMNGTLNSLPPSKLIEMPVAENLIMGVGMGMALEGFHPVVCFERMDFMLSCADAIINHLNALPKLSGCQFNFPLIIRACVGYNEPLDPGIQHMCDYTELFKKYTDICVTELVHTNMITEWYKMALKSNKPWMLVEYKRLYNKEE